jgi:hypothetical protein
LAHICLDVDIHSSGKEESHKSILVVEASQMQWSEPVLNRSNEDRRSNQVTVFAAAILAL